MRDRREEVFDRVMAIVNDVPNIRAVYRNVDSNPEYLRPSVILKDGEEEAPPFDTRNQHRYAIQNVVTITPEIILIAAGNEESMPGQLAAMRMWLIPALVKDTTLRSICTDNGNVRYAGASLKDDYGVLLQGEMRLTFEITYPILDSDFT